MTKFVATAALASLVSMAVVAEANAWTRSGSVTGPRGTSTVQGSGSCAGGACSRSVTRTGPYGGTMTRQGSASCSGGTCSGSRTTTYQGGTTVTRQGSISR